MGELDADGLADAYRAPVADWADEQGRAAEGEETDYVVSPTKLVLLFTATFGLYGVYWFYKHWQHQKLVGSPTIWPWARAIFSVFYVTRLFKQLDWDTRSVGRAQTWNPTAHAVIFIVVNVMARVLDKMSDLGAGSMALGALALVFPLLSAFPLVTAQRVVNESVGDPHGSRNSKLGAGDVVVLLVGALAWALMVAGLLAPPA